MDNYKSSKAAIIIVNWNGLRFLKKCLQAVFGQTYKNFDVYFVDNGSKDGSVDFVRHNFPKTKIIELDYNTGFAKGNNVGIKEAFKDKDVKYIVFLNNDTIVGKKWLEELVRIAERNKDIGMVSSKSLFPNGKIQTIGLSLERNIYGSQNGGISIGYGSDPEKFSKEIEIFAPSGVSALYKRKVLEQIGMFDEDFFCYAEDLDLGFRARLAGWKCIYNPKSKLIHFHSQSGRAASLFKAFYTKRNSYFVAIKNFDLYDLLCYPFRDFYWNFKNFFKKNKLESVNRLKFKIGFLGILKLILGIYLDVIRYLPKTFKKRSAIQRNRKINNVKYEGLFCLGKARIITKQNF